MIGMIDLISWFDYYNRKSQGTALSFTALNAYEYFCRQKAEGKTMLLALAEKWLRFFCVCLTAVD